MTTHDIIQQYQHGLIQHWEAIQALEAIQVRGEFAEDDRFVGYDYINQTWIESAYGITVEGL